MRMEETNRISGTIICMTVDTVFGPKSQDKQTTRQLVLVSKLAAVEVQTVSSIEYLSLGVEE
jgi:hypothetical protein